MERGGLIPASGIWDVFVAAPIRSKTRSAPVFTPRPVEPEQRVPSGCAVTAAGSHRPGGQVLRSGTGAAFNEL